MLAMLILNCLIYYIFFHLKHFFILQETFYCDCSKISYMYISLFDCRHVVD